VEDEECDEEDPDMPMEEFQELIDKFSDM